MVAEVSVEIHGIPRQLRALELASKPFPMNKTNRKLTVTQEPTQAIPTGAHTVSQ